jgi:hypothetical protein
MVILRSLAIGFLLIATPVVAQTDEAELVHVYTNADLERLGPLPVASEPVAANDDDAAWEFVAEFLAREHARLDAARAHDLDRRQVDLEEESVTRRRSYGTYVYPHHYPYRGHRYGDRRHRPGNGLPHVGTPSSLGGRIVPLHARPTLAQAQRAKAIQRSGTDAFPSNARSAD